MAKGLIGSQFAADRFVWFIIVSLKLVSEFSGADTVDTNTSADTFDARLVVDFRSIAPIRVIMTTVMDALTSCLIDPFLLLILICLKCSFILLFEQLDCGDTVIVTAG